MSRSCQIAKVVTAWKKGKVAEGDGWQPSTWLDAQTGL